MADSLLNPGLGVLAGAGTATLGCNELALLYAPSIALALASEGDPDIIASSVVTALANVGTEFSDEDDSIKPVPLASGESRFPAMGHKFSRWRSFVSEDNGMSPAAAPTILPSSAPILSGFGTCCGFCCGAGEGRIGSTLSELFVVIIEGFALFPRLALRINPLSSLSSILDSLDSRPSSITSYPNLRSMASSSASSSNWYPGESDPQLEGMAALDAYEPWDACVLGLSSGIGDTKDA